MPGTPTPRLAIPTLSGSDNVSTYPAVNLAQMTIADGAVLYSEGTYASRPAAAVKGRIYKGTDTGLYYFDTGTTWWTVLLAGPWQNPTLGTGWSLTAPGWPLAARLEGDMLRIVGSVAGSSTSAIVIATLPIGLRPANGDGYAGETSGGWSPGVVPLAVGTSGQISFQASIPAGSGYLSLNGMVRFS